ncbi:alpha/beta hydrolase [Mycobacterium sp. E1747]|nr:alpha/beta hydrolase [Mycobacterium sp. E1747]
MEPENGANYRHSKTFYAPTWFTDALAYPFERRIIEIDGCPIHWRAWGNPTSPVLVLVHGGGAHSGWWDNIAPLLAHHRYVIAPDLSGHGDSGRRSEYSLGHWAQEIIAVADAVSTGAQPAVIGHSMGGWVAATAAIQHPAAIDGIVVIDSPLRDRAPEGGRLRNRGAKPRGYSSRAEITSRFRVVPAQPVTLPYVTSHIAADSVRRSGRRWFWKFDPLVFALPDSDFGPIDPEPLERMLESMQCRTAFVRSERGIVSREMARRIESAMQLRGPFLELAEAGHHPMLDQPLALVATLRTVLEMWSIT